MQLGRVQMTSDIRARDLEHRHLVAERLGLASRPKCKCEGRRVVPTLHADFCGVLGPRWLPPGPKPQWCRPIALGPRHDAARQARVLVWDEEGAIGRWRGSRNELPTQRRHPPISSHLTAATDLFHQSASYKRPKCLADGGTLQAGQLLKFHDLDRASREG